RPRGSGVREDCTSSETGLRSVGGLGGRLRLLEPARERPCQAERSGGLGKNGSRVHANRPSVCRTAALGRGVGSPGNRRKTRSELCRHLLLSRQGSSGSES